MHASIKTTPSKLLLGYDQRCHVDSKITRLINNLANIDKDLSEQRDGDRNVAIEATNRIKAYNKTYYDERHKQPTQYKPGDFVLIRDSQGKPGESRKQKPMYKGPYVVTKALNKNRYMVEDIPGFNLTSKNYNTILSPDRLKPWVKPI